MVMIKSTFSKISLYRITRVSLEQCTTLTLLNERSNPPKRDVKADFLETFFRQIIFDRG